MSVSSGAGLPAVYTVDLAEGVREVVLNQPQKKNAISAPMMDAVRDALFEAEADSSVRAIILRGAGGTFSSGGDLSQTDPSEVTIESTRSTLRHYIHAIRAIRHITKPVIAQVDGFAVGGAFSLVLACDLVCVAQDAKIVPAFVAIGIAPEMGMMDFLPKLVGTQRAKEILLTNKRLSGGDLYELGIANRVCAAEDLEAVTRELATTVARMPALSVQVTKSTINAAADTTLEGVLEAETTASPFCAQTAEAEATMARFARPTGK